MNTGNFDPRQPLGLQADAKLVVRGGGGGALVCRGRIAPLSQKDAEIIQLIDGKLTLSELLAATGAPFAVLDLVRRLGDAGMLGSSAAPTQLGAAPTDWRPLLDAAVVLAAMAGAMALAALAGALDAAVAGQIAGWVALGALAWHTAPYTLGWGRRRANRLLGVPDSAQRLRSWLMRRSVRNTVRQGPMERVEQRYLMLTAWSFCHGFATVTLALGVGLPQAAHFALHGSGGNHTLWATLWRVAPLMAAVAVAAPPLALLLLVLFWLAPQLMPRALGKPQSQADANADAARELADALQELPLFAAIDRDHLLQLAKAARTETYADRAVILRQGDRGDRLCWLAAGNVRVRVEDECGTERDVAALGPGAFFGETALLHPVARTATVVADGPVQVISLGREPFDLILRDLSSQADTIRDQFRTAAALRGHVLFAALDAGGLRSLLAAASTERLPKGADAVRQGETGDLLFVVREGQLEVVRQGTAGARKLATLRPGDWFGELALLGDGTRTATVTALQDAVVVKLPRQAVEQAVLRDVQAAMHLLEAASDRMAALRREEGL